MQKINPKLTVIVTAVFFVVLIFLFRNFLLKYYVEMAQQSIVDNDDLKESIGREILLRECKDSDSTDKQNEQYTKGSVSYINKNGKSGTRHDQCLPGSNSILIEEYCSPRKDGYFVLTNEEYQCINGCIDGACKK